MTTLNAAVYSARANIVLATNCSEEVYNFASLLLHFFHVIEIDRYRGAMRNCRSER